MQLILPLECILVVWRTHKHVFFDLKLNAQQKSLNLQCDTNITNISFNISNLTQHCCHFKLFLPMGVCQAFANSGHFPMPPVNFCLANVPSCSGEGLVLLQFVTPPPQSLTWGQGRQRETTDISGQDLQSTLSQQTRLKGGHGQGYLLRLNFLAYL